MCFYKLLFPLRASSQVSLHRRHCMGIVRGVQYCILCPLENIMSACHQDMTEWVVLIGYFQLDAHSNHT